MCASNGFIHFTPATLEEYACRYACFLNAYHDAPIIKYEDFVTDHETTFKQICEELDLVYLSDPSSVLTALKMTGDSGRRGKDLVLRARREIPTDVAEMRRTSQSYVRLCERLAYDP